MPEGTTGTFWKRGLPLPALLALAWITSRQSDLLDIGVVILYAVIGLLIMWIGVRNDEIARRHPGFAWFAVGIVSIFSSVAMIRKHPRDWEIALLLGGLLMTWRGLYLDRRAEKS